MGGVFSTLLFLWGGRVVVRCQRGGFTGPGPKLKSGKIYGKSFPPRRNVERTHGENRTVYIEDASVRRLLSDFQDKKQGGASGRTLLSQY